MRFPILISLFLFSATLSAGLYKWVDDQGTVHYSDHPVEQAEELEVSGTRILREQEIEKEREEKAEEAGKSKDGNSLPKTEPPAPGEYTEFEILDPEENQTIRSDAGEVRVGMLLEPALQEGHRILLKVDGTPLQQSNVSTHLILQDVPRGSHSMQASIVDEEGQTVISTKVVHFHVRKTVLKTPEP